MDMSGLGSGHWIFVAAMAAVVLYPIGRILRRAGFSPFWSVLAVVPLVNLIGLWIFSTANWPGSESKDLKPAIGEGPPWTPSNVS
jgi:predicted PurR-regulated permease PerM